jgi:hypothetical protein
MIFMRRIMEYIKHRMRTKIVQIESPASFLRDIKSRVFVDRKPMRSDIKSCNEKMFIYTKCSGSVRSVLLALQKRWN